MRRLYFFLLSYFAIGFLPLQAQFKGGAGDGGVVAFADDQPLGRNIFRGGIDDGFTVSLANNQPLGRNIFLGGDDDGFTAALANNQSLGRNIFLGGIDDGIAMGIANNQLIGRNIFLGGNDDGFSMSLANDQPLGRNVFLGGANDGWAMATGMAEGSALPLVLTDFSGQWQQNDAKLLWKTSSETNTSHFELERSLDGNNFTAFASITAAGQSTTPRNYQHLDSNRKVLLPPASSIVYYRLRSIDQDGKFTYSGIVILRTDRSGAVQYAIYPNPAKDIITVSTTALLPNQGATLLLADATGKLVLRQPMRSNQQQLTVSSLPNGTYFLQIVDNNKILYTQKIIIHK